jgi:hypothetical protein
MEIVQPSPPANFGAGPTAFFRENLVDALRFWEPRRILYNAILAAVTISWFAATWPHFRPALQRQYLVPLTGLALIANVLYCAAYLVDIPMQRSSLSVTWKRHRWALWLIGTLFAFLLTNYWIGDEIYPDFH